MPQAQLTSFAAVPSVLAQEGSVLQRSLLDVSQKRPVADAHIPEVPQMQDPATLPVFGVAPSWWRQAGPVTGVHRQACEGVKSQETPEPVSVLKTRPPPLLLLLQSWHPRG